MKGLRVAVFSIGLLLGIGQAQVVLEYWTTSNEVTGPVYEEIVANFNAANPDIQVNLTTFANEAYKTAIQVGLASSDPPDIFFNWAGDDTGRFVREGQLASLDEAATDDAWGTNLAAGAINAFSHDGSVYGVPFSQESKYFFYNSRIFDELGLSEPQSFSELLDLCRTLRENDIVPMSFGNSERWQGVHYLSIFNQKVVGEEVITRDYSLNVPDDELFADPNYASAFQKLVDMRDAGCFTAAPNATSPEIAWAEFYTEQVAMTYGGTWTIGTFNSNGFEGQYGFFRMPPIEGGQGNQNYVLAGPIGLEISARAEDMEAARRFVDFFVNFENQQLMLTDAGRIPVFAEVVTPELASEELFAAVQDLNTAEGTVLWLDTVLEASVADTYLNVIQEVLAGTKTPEEAAADVRQAALRAKQTLGL